MAEANTNRKARTVGVNFPRGDEGDFTYEALMLTKEQEDRSLSQVSYRILREYFAAANPEFKALVEERLESGPPFDLD